jgi:hypothetical protein
MATRTSIITSLSGQDRVSDSRVVLNESITNRHSLDRVDITFADTPFTALVTDHAVIVNGAGGAVTVNLPAAADAENLVITIVATSIAGGNVTIDGSGAETIDGSATKVLSSAYTPARLFSNGTEWISV